MHYEIGIGNDILDSLSDWIEECFENLTEEEIVSRNLLFKSTIANNVAKQKLQEFIENNGTDLDELKEEIKRVQADIQRKGRKAEEKADNLRLLPGRKEDKATLQQQLDFLKLELEMLKENVTISKEYLTAATAGDKRVRKKKGRRDRTVRTWFEDLLKKNEIECASYHGGSYNGVNIRKLMNMDVANKIFGKLKEYLLADGSMMYDMTEDWRPAVIQKRQAYEDLIVVFDGVF